MEGKMRVALSVVTALSCMLLAEGADDSQQVRCSSGYYSCDYGSCIPDYKVCDGHQDCPYYGDDENNCDAYWTTTRWCPADYYECKYDGKCIPPHWVCDGYEDCRYGDDEDNCAFTTEKPTTPRCPAGYYECKYDGRCIPSYWVCNGHEDCRYGDDEDNCISTTEEPTTPRCPAGYYECKYDGRCIPSYWVCDGDEDCRYYGDDEDNCAFTTEEPTTERCPAGYYECKYDGRCIPSYWVCNGHEDCRYGDDEGNCPSTTTAHHVSTSPPPMRCQNPFDLIMDRCVFVDPFIASNWDEARYLCQKFDSDLVILQDFNFYSALLQYMDDRGLNSHDYWVGARDQHEGNWRWIDNSPVRVGAPLWALYGCNDTFELEPEPSEAEFQDCGYLDSDRALYMNDASCDEILPSICQKWGYAVEAEAETKEEEPKVVEEREVAGEVEGVAKEEKEEEEGESEEKVNLEMGRSDESGE